MSSRAARAVASASTRDGAAEGPAVHVIREAPLSGPVPLYQHTEWIARFPWLVQGITARGSEDPPFDLGLSGAGPVGRVLPRWQALRRRLGAGRVVYGRQVHGTDVAAHDDESSATLSIFGACDGHATDREGVLLAVSVADCVPVYVLDPRRRAVALLHGGWRGVGAGILEAGTRTLVRRFGARPADLHLHVGPAICGVCYEVGPEVHTALGLPTPPAAEPLNLRGVLLERAAALGVPAAQMSRSAFCTRCGAPDASGPERPFFSHRAGDAERQMAVLGIRGPSDAGRRPAPDAPSDPRTVP